MADVFPDAPRVVVLWQSRVQDSGGGEMSYLVVFLVFFGCVKLLEVSKSPKLAAGVFAACWIAVSLLSGGVNASLLVGAVAVAIIAFCYFWLLDRTDGSGLWWIVLIVGVALPFVPVLVRLRDYVPS